MEDYPGTFGDGLDAWPESDLKHIFNFVNSQIYRILQNEIIYAVGDIIKPKTVIRILKYTGFAVLYLEILPIIFLLLSS